MLPEGGQDIRWNYHQKFSNTQSHIPLSYIHTQTHTSASIDSWSRSRQDDSEGYHYSSTNKRKGSGATGKSEVEREVKKARRFEWTASSQSTVSFVEM